MTKVSKVRVLFSKVAKLYDSCNTIRDSAFIPSSCIPGMCVRALDLKRSMKTFTCKTFAFAYFFTNCLDLMEEVGSGDL